MGNSSSSNNAVLKVLDPQQNGLANSVKKTTDDLNKSIADTTAKVNESNANIKTKIDDSNAQIGQNLQNNLNATSSKLDSNLASTKSALDNSLEKTKNSIDYNALQKATGVISQIASINPAVYLGLEAINKISNGDSNKYLNASDNTGNPLLNTFQSVFSGLMGGASDAKKSLEAPFDIGKLNPFQQDTTTQPQPYDPNSTTSKYSSFDSSGQTVSKNEDNKLLQFIIPGTIGALVLAGLIYTTKKK